MTTRAFGSIVGLSPEWLERYEVLHRHVFPGVLDRLQRSNIRNYSIFLGPAREDVPATPDGPVLTLFSHLEYVGADHPADMAAIAADETTREWWKLTDPMQTPLPERAEGTWWASLAAWHTIGRPPEVAAASPAALRRVAIAMKRPGDIGGEVLARFSACVARFGENIRTLRAFEARHHLYLYLETLPDFRQAAFVEAADRALGGATNLELLREVFHMDGAMAPRDAM